MLNLYSTTKITLQGILGILILASCQGIKYGEINYMTLPEKDAGEVIDLKSQQFSKDSSFHFSDIFCNVSYIPLEVTLESAIGRIDKLEVTLHNDFIIFDRQNGIIARFDSTGHFLNHLGYRGHGNNEYVFPKDVVYDMYNNQFIVYDLAKKSLLFYDETGECTKKIELDYVFESFTVVDSTHIVTFSNNLRYAKQSDTLYNFRVISHTGQVIAQYDPYKSNRHTFRPNSDYTFKYQLGRMLCNRMYTPLVFSISLSDIAPLYYIDLGSKQIPQECLSSDSDIELSDQSNFSQYSFCKSFYESEDYYILNVVEKRNLCICFIPKNSRHICICGYKGDNDICGLVSNTEIKYVTRNDVYFVVDPQYFSQKRHFYLQRGINISIKDKNTIEEYSNLTNPIIQKCTLK